MKKAFVFFAFFMVCMCCRAQDVVVMNNGDTLRVSVTRQDGADVYYRQYNNPNGPEFMLTGSEIVSVHRAEPEQVTAVTSEAVADTTAVSEINTAPVDTMVASTEDKTSSVLTDKEQPISSTHIPLFDRDGNTYMVDGMPMNKNMFADYLTKNVSDPRWGEQFRSAIKLSRNGWAMLGVGVGAGFAGMITIIVGAAKFGGDPDDRLSEGLILGGAAGMVVGEGLTAAGGACVCVGFAHMHDIADAYGVSVRNPEAPVYWSLNASRNGIGLALNF